MLVRRLVVGIASPPLFLGPLVPCHHHVRQDSLFLSVSPAVSLPVFPTAYQLVDCRTDTDSTLKAPLQRLSRLCYDLFPSREHTQMGNLSSSKSKYFVHVCVKSNQRLILRMIMYSSFLTLGHNGLKICFADAGPVIVNHQ